jgi:DivIVA domain-containing protein
MAEKLKLSPKAIVNKKFTRDVKGYFPDEVDGYLDDIILDYEIFEKNTAEYEAKIADLQGKLVSLPEENQRLWEKNKQLDIENATLHRKFDGIKPSDAPTAENIQYLQRIRQLEDFLYSEGYNPSNLKSRTKK